MRRANFAPLWSRDGAPVPEVASTLRRLQRAGDDGLDLKGLPSRVQPRAVSPEEFASADIALSEAVVAYGREASGSRVDPRAISRADRRAPGRRRTFSHSGGCLDRRRWRWRCVG